MRDIVVVFDIDTNTKRALEISNACGLESRAAITLLAMSYATQMAPSRLKYMGL